MPFTAKKLNIDDVVLIEPKVFGDDRGFFMEAFKKSGFEALGICSDIVQINHSKSSKGVVRGLHYQLNPNSQGKIVRVVKGRVFDVAVDLRKGSPSFGKWVGEILSDENKNILWVPQGFAHGFCTLSDDVELIYYCTGSEYSPEGDKGVIWNDKQINVDWPIKNPIISSKDASLPTLGEAEINFE